MQWNDAMRVWQERETRAKRKDFQKALHDSKLICFYFALHTDCWNDSAPNAGLNCCGEVKWSRLSTERHRSAQFSTVRHTIETRLIYYWNEKSILNTLSWVEYCTGEDRRARVRVTYTSFVVSHLSFWTFLPSAIAAAVDAVAVAASYLWLGIFGLCSTASKSTDFIHVKWR